ncbi:hypothetical protein LBMAG34_5710 [Candidatus Saccharibacteria bacterium]|nr:hypothetical protein LBMAG34_5710 [Candidatus Saccharibacteria bacterium]
MSSPNTLDKNGSNTKVFKPAVPDLTDIRPAKNVDQTKLTVEHHGERFKDHDGLLVPEDYQEMPKTDQKESNKEAPRPGDLVPAEPRHLEAALKRAKEEDISETAVAGAMGNEPYTTETEDDGPTPFTDYSVFRPKGEQVDGDPVREGYQKIGEAVNKRIDELKQEGMSDSDAHAKAHDEFWGMVDSASPKPEPPDNDKPEPPDNDKPEPPDNDKPEPPDNDKPEPPDNDKPPGPPPGPPGPPENDEGPNNEQQTAEELQRATADLEGSIHHFAQARIEREKLFGGGSAEKRLLEREGQALQESFRRYTEAISKDFAARSENIENAFEGQKESLQRDAAELTNTRALAAQKLSTLQETLDTTTDPTEKAKIQIDMLAYQALDAQTQAELSNIQAELQQIDADKAVELQRLEVEKNERISEALIEVEQRVNAEMLEIREQKRPKIAKLNEWLRRKPGVRIAIGAGLAAMGVFGVVTGAVPLVALAMGGKAIMAGAGGYNAARGIGERIANRGYEKANVDSIEEYVEAAGNQSNTRRKSKKAGVVAGAALAAIPVVRGANEIFNATPDPGIPSDYNPGAYRMAGIVTERPSAGSQFTEMVTNPNPNPSILADAKAAESLMDAAYSRVAPGMSFDQLKNLDAVIGRLSASQGYGNGFTAGAMDTLADQIKSGLGANDIIKQMNLGPPIPGL